MQLPPVRYGATPPVPQVSLRSCNLSPDASGYAKQNTTSSGATPRAGAVSPFSRRVSTVLRTTTAVGRFSCRELYWPAWAETSTRCWLSTFTLIRSLSIDHGQAWMANVCSPFAKSAVMVWTKPTKVEPGIDLRISPHHLYHQQFLTCTWDPQPWCTPSPLFYHLETSLATQQPTPTFPS